MRQRPWQLQTAVLLAALCCSLNGAAAKQTTTATVCTILPSICVAGRGPSDSYLLYVLLTAYAAAGQAGHTLSRVCNEGCQQACCRSSFRCNHTAGPGSSRPMTAVWSPFSFEAAGERVAGSAPGASAQQGEVHQAGHGCHAGSGRGRVATEAKRHGPGGDHAARGAAQRAPAARRACSGRAQTPPAGACLHSSVRAQRGFCIHGQGGHPFQTKSGSRVRSR